VNGANIVPMVNVLNMVATFEAVYGRVALFGPTIEAIHGRVLETGITDLLKDPCVFISKEIKLSAYVVHDTMYVNTTP